MLKKENYFHFKIYFLTFTMQKSERDASVFDLST